MAPKHDPDLLADPERLEKLAVLLRRQRDLGKEMDETRRAIAEIRGEDAEGRSRARRLPRVSTSRIVPDEMVDVDTRKMSLGAKIGAGRTTRMHKAKLAWLKAGKTVQDIAEEIREKRTRVNSWLNEGDGNRAIPEKHVEYFSKHYKIPRSAWTRIASE